jgi:N-acetylmuramic acid 6-phosphate etherase
VSSEQIEDDPVNGEHDLMYIELKVGRVADAGVHNSAQSTDIVLGVAASGRTPYVLGAVAYARRIGCRTACVCCNSPCALADAVDLPVCVVVGAEVIAGSTRMLAGAGHAHVHPHMYTGRYGTEDGFEHDIDGGDGAYGSMLS